MKALMNPMQPVLAGFLAGSVIRDGREIMKIQQLFELSHDRFKIRFGSGTVLEVQVRLIESNEVTQAESNHAG